jgi:hypothetical protein
LRPVRYQFAAGASSEDKGWNWDANWLVIRGDIKTTDGRRWSFEDPCLTTREARELGQWLRGVVSGVVAASPSLPVEPGRLEIFTEPALALSLEDRGQQDARVRLHLSQEALPPWLDSDSPDEFEFFIPFHVGLDELALAADEWDRQLLSFPER